MSQLAWNPVTANFSGSDASMRTAVGSIGQVGTVFDQIAKNIATERQNRVQNELAFSKDAREKQVLEQNLLQDADAASVTAALQDAYKSSLNKDGTLDYTGFTELTKGIVPQTKAGSDVANTFLSRVDDKVKSTWQREIDQSKLDIDQQQVDIARQNAETSRQNAASQRAYQNAMLALQKNELRYKTLKEIADIEKERRKEAREREEKDSSITPQSTIKDWGVDTSEKSTKEAESFLNNLYNSTKDPSSNIAGLYGTLSRKDMSSILGSSLKTDFTYMGLGDNSVLSSDYTEQLASASQGVPSYLTAALITKAIHKSNDINSMQREFIKNNPQFFTGIPTDIAKGSPKDIKLKPKSDTNSKEDALLNRFLNKDLDIMTMF